MISERSVHCGAAIASIIDGMHNSMKRQAKSRRSAWHHGCDLLTWWLSTICGPQAGRGAPNHRSGPALRYQPPHSPDLNPIEQTFAKLKAHLRQAKERIGQGLESFQAGAAAISKVPSKFGPRRTTTGGRQGASFVEGNTPREASILFRAGPERVIWGRTGRT